MQIKALRTIDSEIGFQKFNSFIFQFGRLSEDQVPDFGIEKYPRVDRRIQYQADSIRYLRETRI